jgi:hypothetical protein
MEQVNAHAIVGFCTRSRQKERSMVSRTSHRRLYRAVTVTGTAIHHDTLHRARAAVQYLVRHANSNHNA